MIDALLDPHAIRVFLDEHHIDLARRIRQFSHEQIATLPEPADDGAARAQAREIVALLGQEGWYTPILDQDLRAIALVRETLAFDSPLADAVYALQALGTTPIVLAGSAEVKANVLPRVRSGEFMTAFAMTEPDAGSDVASMQSTATRKGRQYTLNGRKTFISNAGIADHYTVFASLDPSRGSKGIACFAVDAATPGLEFVRPQVMSAPHPLGEMAFNDCLVPASAMIADAPEGFKLGLKTLDRLRATVAAAACGMACRALSEALSYAVERRQFGKPLADFQLTQAKLATMATELTAARLLVYRAAWEADHGAPRVTLESAMAKAFATEAAQRIVDQAVQILGGRGVLADHPVDRLYRSVRALRIYEGTTEVQQLTIAGQLIKRHRESTSR